MNASSVLHTFLGRHINDHIKDTIRTANVKNLVLLALVTVIGNLYHVLVFLPKIDAPTVTQHTWALSITLCHAISMFFFLIVGALFYLQWRKKMFSNRIVDLLLVAVFLFLVLFGVALVTFDQLITPAITPYLVLCVAVSLIVLIPPVFSLTILAFSYLLFYLGVGMYQLDPSILLSNRVNGVTAIFLGILISNIFWNSTLTRYKQRYIIEQQKNYLEKNNAQLTEANASKDKLFSIVAHDLISPFNVILGMSNLLKEELSSFKRKEIERMVGNIHATSVQTYNLLTELLTWSRVQSGNIVYEPIFFPLQPVCEQVLKTLTPSATSKNLVIDLQVDAGLRVFADVEMTKIILRNLISNAIKYTHSGGCITLAASVEHDEVRVEVSDQGVGIAAENLNQLFSKTGKVSMPGTANEQGVGLGLTVCYEFVEIQGGTLNVESTLNQGSRFWFNLKQVPV